MRFANVNGEEIRAIFVVVIDLDHVADVVPEWRSSVAAKNYDERSRAGAFTQMKVARAVQGQKANVRCIFTHAQLAAMHVRESVSHHAIDVFGAAGHKRETG